MPKARTAPKYSVAAKLKGWARVRYLRDGHFTGPAAELVDRLKFHHDSARACREKHPCPPFTDAKAEGLWRTHEPVRYAEMVKDAVELRAAMIKSAEQEVADVLTKLRVAVVANDAPLFRQIADVLDHDSAHAERLVAVGDGNKVLWRSPANLLATTIAAWATQRGDAGQSMRFSDLWDHLCQHENHKRAYSGLTYERMKSAKATLRIVAREIGVRFSADRLGPKVASLPGQTATR